MPTAEVSLLLLQGTGHAGRAAMIAEAQKVLLLIKSNLMKIYGLESFCTSELFCDEVRSLSRYDRLCLKRMDDTLLPGMGEHGGETYRFPFGEELKLVARTLPLRSGRCLPFCLKKSSVEPRPAAYAA